jgi:hypothetical protein
MVYEFIDEVSSGCEPLSEREPPGQSTSAIFAANTITR